MASVVFKLLCVFANFKYLFANDAFLIKPTTYMNSSGTSIRKFFKYYNDMMPYESLIVIHDDLDLDLGKIKIKYGGGSGGHKGVKSIFSENHTKDFIRVRIGIGKPLNGDIINYVLSKFKDEEISIINKQIEKVNKIIKVIMENGLRFAMNEFNGKG